MSTLFLDFFYVSDTINHLTNLKVNYKTFKIKASEFNKIFRTIHTKKF